MPNKLLLPMAFLVLCALPAMATVYSFTDLPADKDLGSLDQDMAYQWELLYPNTQGNADHYTVTSAYLRLLGIYNANPEPNDNDVLWVDLLTGTHSSGWTLLTGSSVRPGNNAWEYSSPDSSGTNTDYFSDQGWVDHNVLTWQEGMYPTGWQTFDPKNPAAAYLDLGGTDPTWLGWIENSLNTYGGVTFGFDPDCNFEFYGTGRIQFDITIETEEGFYLPEPGTYALLALALGVPFYFRRRKS